MRRTTTWTLVVGCAAAAATGAARADDAERSGTRGSVVLPVGDKVHGFLRGGETHALRVHLAKGDVYSFSANSQKRGDSLLMHLTFRDPSGREINGDARVDHRANGKKITVGPFKAPASGTYVIELYAQTWFGGDYWGASTIRAPRRSIVSLPSDGAAVDVNVAAGSVLRLRAKGLIANFAMTTPGGVPSLVAGTDPLVSSLRSGGLASSETGVYQFGAKGAATLDVTRPLWRATTLEVPLLPEDPSRLAQFEFALGWNPRQIPVMPDPAVVATPPSTPIGPPVPVGGASSTGSTGSAASTNSAPLFIGGAITAATAFTVHPPMDDGGSVAPPDPLTTPPVTAPPINTPPLDMPAVPRNFDLYRSPLHVTDFGIPTTVTGPSLPPLYGFGCADSIGRSMFFGVNAADAYSTATSLPWRMASSGVAAQMGVHYPDAVKSAIPNALLTRLWLTKPVSSKHGDSSDPYFSQTFQFTVATAGPLDGTIVTRTRYYVDGHQAPSLLATGGDTSITWTVEGSGNVNGTPWSLSGSWKILMQPVSDERIPYLYSGAIDAITSCVITGEERCVAGSVQETVAMPGMWLVPQVFTMGGYNAGTAYWYDPVGVIRNTLEVTDVGLAQSVERSLPPATLWPDGLDRYKHVDVKLITIDPTTNVEGVEDYEWFDWFLC